MSDDESPEAQRPNPGANAARRARRIGGRPAPVPAARPSTGVDVDEPVALTKSAPQPSASTTDAPPSRAGSVRALPLAWFPAAVLAVATVLMLVLLGVFSYRGYWAKPGTAGVSAPSNAEQEQVLATAKTCFATINTYNYTTLAQALANGLKCTTGTFTSDYRVAFETQIEKNAPTVKAVQTAQVNKAGIISVAPDGKQWTVLIFGQLQTINVSTAKGTPRISPVGGVVTMDCVGGSGVTCDGGKWLVAKVDVDTGTGLGS